MTEHMPVMGTAEEALANLRANAGPGVALQFPFPSAGVDLYVTYFPECGHYGAIVTPHGRTDVEVIREVELDKEQVMHRMFTLLEVDMARDPMGRDLRLALELSMTDEG